MLLMPLKLRPLYTVGTRTLSHPFLFPHSLYNTIGAAKFLYTLDSISSSSKTLCPTSPPPLMLPPTCLWIYALALAHVP